MKILNLGIVYDEYGKIRNHRSLLKVIFNPILRALLGWQIATPMKGNKLGRPILNKCGRQFTGWRYELPVGWKVVPHRRWI